MSNDFEAQVNEIFATKEPEVAEATEEPKVDVAGTEEVEAAEEPKEEDGGESEELQTEEDEASEDSGEEDEKQASNADFVKKRHNKKFKELEEETKYLRETLSKMVSNNQQSQTPASVEEAKQPIVNPFDADIEPESYNLWNETKAIREQIEQMRYESQVQKIALKKETEELKVAQSVPDYIEKKQFLIDRQTALAELQNSHNLKSRYPQATDEQIRGFLRQQASEQVDNILMNSVMNGQDLNETLETYSKYFGYTPKAKQESQATLPKVDLNKIKENKKRSNNINGKGLTGENTTGRRSSEQVAQSTLADLLGMDGQDFAKIDYDA